MAGVAFTKDGRYMAVAERRDCKDFISIFVCRNWQLLRVSSASSLELPAHIAHCSMRNSDRASAWYLGHVIQTVHTWDQSMEGGSGHRLDRGN